MFFLLHVHVIDCLYCTFNFSYQGAVMAVIVW